MLTLKWKVHPKISLRNLCTFLNAKKDIFDQKGAPLTSIVGKKYYRSQWCP